MEIFPEISLINAFAKDIEGRLRADKSMTPWSIQRYKKVRHVELCVFYPFEGYSRTEAIKCVMFWDGQIIMDHHVNTDSVRQAILDISMPDVDTIIMRNFKEWSNGS